MQWDFVLVPRDGAQIPIWSRQEWLCRYLEDVISGQKINPGIYLKWA